jgi:hypothetical protein
MARNRSKAPRASSLDALLEAGDHRAARAAARARLAAGAEDAEARAVLDSLAPDRGALVAGALGVAIAVAIAAWTVLAG